MLTDRSGPLRVAVLSSRRAPGVEYLLHHRERGRTWQVVGGLVTDPCGELLEIGHQTGLPVILHDIRSFYAARGAPLNDLAVRRAYDRETVARLAPVRPDIVLLTGYLYIVTEPLLATYAGRVVNVHDSDLSVRRPDGVPRYRGLHSTRDAMAAGERETRLTAHLVTEEVDAGPILARSPGFPVPTVAGGEAPEARWQQLKRAAWIQRDRMMREAWGPLLAAALTRLARPRSKPAPARAAGRTR